MQHHRAAYNSSKTSPGPSAKLGLVDLASGKGHERYFRNRQNNCPRMLRIIVLALSTRLHASSDSLSGVEWEKTGRNFVSCMGKTIISASSSSQRFKGDSLSVLRSASKLLVSSNRCTSRWNFDIDRVSESREQCAARAILDFPGLLFGQSRGRQTSCNVSNPVQALSSSPAHHRPVSSHCHSRFSQSFRFLSRSLSHAAHQNREYH